MRTLLVSLVAAITVAVAPAPASACDGDWPLSRFEMMAPAAIVAIVTPTVVPPIRRRGGLPVGDVTLAVEAMVKGSPVKTITVTLEGTDCDPGFELGARTLIFQDDQGRWVSEYTSVMVIHGDAVPDLLRRWTAATDDAGRAAVAADAVAGAGDAVFDGALVLRDHPELAAALTADGIAAIAAAWPALHRSFDRQLLRRVKNRDLGKALDAARRAERRAHRRPAARPHKIID